MQKIKGILLVSILSLMTTGCFKSDTMEDITINTSVYPLEYRTERLYGNSSEVRSIYPDGINVNDYELTKKQIIDYSNVELFIFNGLTDEKNYVTDFFKENKKIKIIDGTSSMEILNNTEELWLNPSNFLMMTQNVKNGFNEYVTNHYIKQEIVDNYEDLKLEISNLDASISKVSENSEHKVIIVSDNMFNFLKKYGFEVISLEDASEKTYSDAYNYIKSGITKNIFIPKNSDLNDVTKKLIEETKVNVIELHTLSNISENERKNKDDYISLMTDNIDKLKLELYK